MVRRCVPEVGDIVWLAFDLQVGFDTTEHRPAMVPSQSTYNNKTRLMLCCPMTSQVKGYPFEVLIAGARPSAALADQVKGLD